MGVCVASERPRRKRLAEKLARSASSTYSILTSPAAAESPAGGAGPSGAGAGGLSGGIGGLGGGGNGGGGAGGLGGGAGGDGGLGGGGGEGGGDGGGGGGGDGDDDDDARPLPAGDDDGDAWTLAEALARCAAARYAPLGALLPLGAQLRVLLLHAAGVVPELASLETLTAIRAPARQPPSARGDERWARAWAGVRLDDVPGWPLWAAPVHDALREVAPSLRILFAAHAATHARAHAAPALAATPAHATAAPAHAAAGALLSAAEWQALVRGAGWGLGGLAQPQLLALYNTSGIGMSIVPDQERGRTAPRTARARGSRRGRRRRRSRPVI
jgi:hypothetical protein